jgi:hypothetical protein
MCNYLELTLAYIFFVKSSNNALQRQCLIQVKVTNHDTAVKTIFMSKQIQLLGYPDCYSFVVSGYSAEWQHHSPVDQQTQTNKQTNKQNKLRGP